MKIHPTSIQGVLRVETLTIDDKRGSFLRAFCSVELRPILQDHIVQQINTSRTTSPGAIRGLHFQYPPYAEMKLVRCLRGRVWDVALDLRCGSSTYLQWYAEELSPANSLMLVIPEGCAHGFQVLDRDSELLYLHTAPYNAAYEGGVRFDDPAARIAWPRTATDVSQRDMSFPLLTKAFKGIIL